MKKLQPEKHIYTFSISEFVDFCSSIALFLFFLWNSKMIKKKIAECKFFAYISHV